MNPQWIISSLRELHRSFRDILDDDAGDIIEDAIAGVEVSKQQYDERKRRSDNPRLVAQPWGYKIDPDRPLRFKTSSAIKGIEPRLDIFSTVLWMDEREPPISQDTHLRLWSSSDYVYREMFDSTEILNKLTDSSRTINGRVMWRCHFDLANPGQSGPKYHLQFGGNPRQDEDCWFPEIIDLPRLICPPIDLILACQVVAANFFWDKYSEFRDSPEWMIVLRHSQEHLLKSYYKECFDAINNKHSLLDYLWNA